MTTSMLDRIRALAAGPRPDSPVHAAGYGIEPPGFRLPAETRIGRVTLQVADMERSLAWYGHVLGLRVLERRDGRAVLGPHGDDAPLVELREKPGVRPVPRRGLLGLYHFAVLLPDRASLGRFLAHLGRTGVQAGMSDHLVSEAIYLTDPDGLGIEVYADRPRERWHTEGRQLAMSTDPLDVHALLRAGGGQPWAGAPAGTRIGHVHLYVADLERAAAFYHAGLGFDAVVWGYPGALFVSAGGYHHHVGLNTWAAGAPAATDDDARLVHWELILPDAAAVDAALDSLRASGFDVAASSPAGRVGIDPWGVAVRLVAAMAG